MLDVRLKTAIRELGAYTQGRLVERPEHPFLYRGPDLLYAEKGLLVAFFASTARERRTPDLLTARVATARLALPPRTACVLVGAVADSQTDSGSRDFDAAIHGDHRADYGSVIRDFRGFDRIRVPKAVRDKWLLAAARRLQWVAEATADRRPEQRRNARHSTEIRQARHVSLYPWRTEGGGPGRVVTLRTLQLDGDVIESRSGAARPRARTEAACTATVRFRYTVDDGVLYPRGSPPVFYTVKAPTYPNLDPTWDFRVAAFVGAIPLPGDYGPGLLRDLAGRALAEESAL